MRSIDDIRQMLRPVVAGLVAMLLLGSGVALPAMAQEGDASARMQTPDGFDQTTFRVTVYGNGSATWTIEHRTPLQNESDQSQFESFAEEFENTETPLYRNFVEQSTLLTRYGTNTTGREMSASHYERSASVDPLQSTGAVRMSFRWDNFAVVSDGSVLVSDVFEGGFYIGESQSFVFERGPELAFADVRPAPDSQSAPDDLRGSESVTWNGERSFNDRRPYVELEPRENGATAAGATGGDSPDESQTAGTPATAGGGGPSWLLPALVLLALAVGGAAAWRSGAVARVLGGDGDGGPAAETGGESVTAAETTDAPAAAEGDAEAETEPAVSDEELLTDSDRVINLLEDNGGRMKQVDIVDNTDWSKSKVSMLLSDMEEEGDISKLRVGRENIISLSGQEPDAAGSPFDDE
ncbi:helix-turn-helix transcriptional regulator [Haloarcula salina]|uniref:helix-turn-helix transcriptional regulator n=1 Tax=Haloarcula salina TaxID=1429914 RepID=UPI003C704276